MQAIQSAQPIIGIACSHADNQPVMLGTMCATHVALSRYESALAIVRATLQRRVCHCCGCDWVRCNCPCCGCG